MSIVDFLTARLDEDEAVLAQYDEDMYRPTYQDWAIFDGDNGAPQVEPRRLRADIAAKRRLIQLAVEWIELGDAFTVTYSEQAFQIAYDHALRCIARGYSDHPDYDQEWAL